MTIATPLALCWERAQHIDRSAIEPPGLGWYIVPSSRDPTGYAVHVEFDPAGQLVAASCTCPDFEKRARGIANELRHLPNLSHKLLADHVSAGYTVSGS